MKVVKYSRVARVIILGIAFLPIFLSCFSNLSGSGDEAQKNLRDEPTKPQLLLTPMPVNLTKPQCSSGSHYGQIAFIESQPTPSKLFFMDGNGCNVRELMQDVSNTLAWAPTSGLIAVICDDSSSVCVLDVEKSTILGETVVLKHIPLPVQCVERWVSSFDWSPDEQNLLIACGGNLETFYLVKISLVQEGETQVVFSSEEEILRVAWSSENKIALSIPPFIYLIDLDGDNLTKLTEGLSPEWSSDGTKLIFVKKREGDARSGIAVINSDGAGFEWVFLPVKPIDFACSEIRPDCRLAWSSDNRYIVFNASYFPSTEPGINYQIFRFNLITDRVEILTNELQSRFYSEPDWKP